LSKQRPESYTSYQKVEAETPSIVFWGGVFVGSNQKVWHVFGNFGRRKTIT